MKKKSAAKGITLKTVIDHIQAFQQRTEMRFDSLENRMGSMDIRMDSMEKRMGSMEQRMEKLDQRLVWMDVQISNIDERLDNIEISIIEQNHDRRIRKCERAIAALSK